MSHRGGGRVGCGQERREQQLVRLGRRPQRRADFDRRVVEQSAAGDRERPRELRLERSKKGAVSEQVSPPFLDVLLSHGRKAVF